jgi:hypothetical protein
MFGSDDGKVGPKDYMNQTWWYFLPFYIYIGFAVLTLIIMAFGGANVSAFLAYIVFAVLIGLLLWWVCDIGQLGWAWFILLIPLIMAALTSCVSGGVASGIYLAEMGRGRTSTMM